MKVVSTEKSQVLGGRISKELGAEFAETQFGRFPDGEQYLQVGTLDKETVIVGSVVDSDTFVQLLLLIDACEGSSATLVLPYLGYARQDRRFREGEPLSARAVARALSSGIRRVITVNVHKESVLGHFGTAATSVTLADDLGHCIGATALVDPLILAPDKGAVEFSRAVARAGGWETGHLEKVRVSPEEVQIEAAGFDVVDRNIFIVDDIISTGGTIATATRLLYDQGARTVHAGCVHGVFAGTSYANLSRAGVAELLASDTIEGPCSRYSAARAIATEVRRCS
jgi:ribose-phosphate pyrophosphokinase